LALFAQHQGYETQATRVWGPSDNLAGIINQLVRYHDFGEYDYDIRQVTNAARDYIAKRVLDTTNKDEKLAAVFDIDETALSNWDALSDCGFCPFKVLNKVYHLDHVPAIAPVLELYNFVKSKDVKIFFLTGRPENQRELTITNLNEAGYSGWTELIMRPNGNTDPARVLKPAGRHTIVNKGYTVILNIGDQASDLAGCCAEQVFKLPNPFYLIP
jgi:predicted secreted acid phosphatase